MWIILKTPDNKEAGIGLGFCLHSIGNCGPRCGLYFVDNIIGEPGEGDAKITRYSPNEAAAIIVVSIEFNFAGIDDALLRSDFCRVSG